MVKPVALERLHAPRTLVKTEEVGNFEALAISDLDTADYQRALSTDFVDQMARNWDLTVAGTILVSRRKNGKLYIVDGQHRVAAALRAGETHILAQVLDGLTQQQEAKLRVIGNNRRGDRAIERFHAQLIAGDSKTKSINNILNYYGANVGVMSGDQSAILAVVAVEKVYDTDKGETLQQVLNIISQAFGTPNGHTATVPVLRGLALFLNYHSDDPRFSEKRLIERLKLEGPEGMERRARTHKAALGGSIYVNWYRAAVEVYNYRLGEQHRLIWK